MDAFRERLRPDTRLAVVMLVNHETGAVQPVGELATTGVAFHTDAAQAVGKIHFRRRRQAVGKTCRRSHFGTSSLRDVAST